MYPGNKGSAKKATKDRALLISHRFPRRCGLERKLALRNVAEHRSKQAYERVRDSRMHHWQKRSKRLDHQVRDQYKGCRSERVPEQLYPSV
jgi:hypothetical protein